MRHRKNHKRAILVPIAEFADVSFYVRKNCVMLEDGTATSTGRAGGKQNEGRIQIDAGSLLALCRSFDSTESECLSGFVND